MEIISFYAPTLEEVQCISKQYDIDCSIIEDGLDFNEHPRIELVNNSLIVIFSMPLICPTNMCDQSTRLESLAKKDYHTAPFMMIFHKENLIIISPAEKEFLIPVVGPSTRQDFFSELGKTRGDILIKILIHISSFFLSELKFIHRTMLALQEHIKSKITNEDMITLLHLQNRLTYYSFALEANEVIADRLLKHEISEQAKLHLAFSQQNFDDLGDIYTDLKQAKSMAHIYASIMKSISGTYSTITTNNVNDVMKVLTALNFIIMIPAIITSAYGMNVSLPGQNHNLMFLFLCLASLGGALVSLYYLRKKGWF